MVNKKGFMRIIEATIAIMLVLSVLIILSIPNRIEESNLRELIPPILEEIGENVVLRQEIMSYNTSRPANESVNAEILANLTNFVEPRIRNPNLNFTVRICDLNVICAIDNYPPGKEIFAAERVVSATLGGIEFKPNKVKIFIWREV